MTNSTPTLSEQIRRSEKTQAPVETVLATDQRVLARITDGIYRRPASALRELISNAYDADATEVIIHTDAPRFNQISVRDNGHGLTPEILDHLIKHIGGSAKRTEEGKTLGVTSPRDENFSPGGRQLIGKMGIGLFSVAQFTHHFLIITKTKSDPFRSIADITLGATAVKHAEANSNKNIKNSEFVAGHARIWRERAVDVESHGTEIKLLDLLRRTKAELASDDQWSRIEYEELDPDIIKTPPPKFHIGRMSPSDINDLITQPNLPWDEKDTPEQKFSRLVNAIRESASTDSDSVDIDLLCDRYLQTIWTLSLSCPLKYQDGHPFDLTPTDDVFFFELENKKRGQAKRIADIASTQSIREKFNLKSPNGCLDGKFSIKFDGVELSRPILFKSLPKTKTAVKTPMLFIGRDIQKFSGKPIELSGGTLSFEAYLFWAPKIIPKQHQGVILRVGNASGELFDRTFMGYQVSEQTRTRQITAEIFVREGLDAAINIDRESFNYAHPHYQYIVKWLHSALRQLANRHKEIGKKIRSERVTSERQQARARIEEKVETSLIAHGIEDVPEIIFNEPENIEETKKLRNEGAVVFSRMAVTPSDLRTERAPSEDRRQKAQIKVEAITQLLAGMGILEKLSYEEQEKLVHDIFEIILMEL